MMNSIIELLNLMLRLAATVSIVAGFWAAWIGKYDIGAYFIAWAALLEIMSQRRT